MRINTTFWKFYIPMIYYFYINNIADLEEIVFVLDEITSVLKFLVNLVKTIECKE